MNTWFHIISVIKSAFWKKGALSGAIHQNIAPSPQPVVFGYPRKKELSAKQR
jgi:hypothetical protein